MPRQTTRFSGARRISDINLTPFTDLTFLLLITFIITFPMLEQGIPVNLPRGQAKDLSAQQARTITVDPAGQVFLDNKPVTLEKLAEAMAALGRSAPDTAILIRADQAIPYGRVMKVVHILYRARLTRMALVTQPGET